MTKPSKAILEMAKQMKQRQGRQQKREPKVAPDPLQGSVNQFAAKHGDFDRHNGRTINRGGTPVARWKAAGLLSPCQEAAILHCVNLWEAADSSRSVVANLDKVVSVSFGDGMKQHEALNDLQRIKGGFPLKYWDIYENVCRHDRPAGIAGSDLANDNVTARTMARTIVCMVADMIYFRERLSY